VRRIAVIATLAALAVLPATALANWGADNQCSVANTHHCYATAVWEPVVTKDVNDTWVYVNGESVSVPESEWTTAGMQFESWMSWTVPGNLLGVPVSNQKWIEAGEHYGWPWGNDACHAFYDVFYGSVWSGYEPYASENFMEPACPSPTNQLFKFNNYDNSTMCVEWDTQPMGCSENGWGLPSDPWTSLETGEEIATNSKPTAKGVNEGYASAGGGGNWEGAVQGQPVLSPSDGGTCADYTTHNGGIAFTGGNDCDIGAVRGIEGGCVSGCVPFIPEEEGEVLGASNLSGSAVQAPVIAQAITGNPYAGFVAASKRRLTEAQILQKAHQETAMMKDPHPTVQRVSTSVLSKVSGTKSPKPGEVEPAQAAYLETPVDVVEETGSFEPPENGSMKPEAGEEYYYEVYRYLDLVYNASTGVLLQRDWGDRPTPAQKKKEEEEEVTAEIKRLSEQVTKLKEERKADKTELKNREAARKTAEAKLTKAEETHERVCKESEEKPTNTTKKYNCENPIDLRRAEEALAAVNERIHYYSEQIANEEQVIPHLEEEVKTLEGKFVAHTATSKYAEEIFGPPPSRRRSEDEAEASGSLMGPPVATNGPVRVTARRFPGAPIVASSRVDHRRFRLELPRSIRYWLSVEHLPPHERCQGTYVIAPVRRNLKCARSAPTQ
jgi:hypothetical protein